MLFIKIYSLHFSEPRIFVAKPLSSQCDSEYHPSCLAPLSDIIDSGFGCQSLSRISPVYLFDFSPFLALLDSYPYSFSLLIVVPPPPPRPQAALSDGSVWSKSAPGSDLDISSKAGFVAPVLCLWSVPHSAHLSSGGFPSAHLVPSREGARCPFQKSLGERKA